MIFNVFAMSNFATQYDVRVLQEQINALNVLTRTQKGDIESLKGTLAKLEARVHILEAPVSPSWKKKVEASGDIEIAFRVLNHEIRELKLNMLHLKECATPTSSPVESVPPPVIKEKGEKRYFSPIRGEAARNIARELMSESPGKLTDTSMSLPPVLKRMKDSPEHFHVPTWRCGYCLELEGENHLRCLMHYDGDYKKFANAMIKVEY